jgi:CO/xanthine dehydrogenase FAD-binding subunit
VKHFEYYKPRSLEEALELKKEIPGSRFIAGGTDLMVQIKSGEVAPPALISLRSISELSSVEVNGNARIGALVTVTDLIWNPDIRRYFPLLAEAALRLGSPQIRNVATVGGNLCNCSPCADLALPLLVLEAKVRIRSIVGTQDIRIEDFFRGPGDSCLSSGQILTEILVEPPPPNTKATFKKKGRVKMDLAVASTAVLLEMEGQDCLKARIAAGSAAPVPLRLVEVESWLEGKELSPEILHQAQKLAMESVAPITDVRGTEEYRRQIIGVFIKRSIEHILGWSTN